MAEFKQILINDVFQPIQIRFFETSFKSLTVKDSNKAEKIAFFILYKIKKIFEKTFLLRLISGKSFF